MIVKEGNVHPIKSISTHCSISGDSNRKVPRKVHVNTASYEEKKQFKKRAQNTRLST